MVPETVFSLKVKSTLEPLFNLITKFRFLAHNHLFKGKLPQGSPCNLPYGAYFQILKIILGKE